MAPKKSKQKSKPKSKAAGSAKVKAKKPAGKTRAKRSQPPIKRAIRRSARGLLKGAASGLQRAGLHPTARLSEAGSSKRETSDSESVEELIEEGQDFEAEMVEAIENAPDPDEGELDAELPADDDPVSDPRKNRNRL